MAKSAKKTSARRATSKKRTGRVTGKTSANRAARYPDDAKFTIAKENPRRKGTGQYDRYEVLKRYSGKTIAALPEKDHTGLVMALRYAEQGGFAKVAGGSK